MTGSVERVEDSLLSICDVEKRYDATVALSGASLSVGRSEIHALLGENGAGKTTLMNVLDGITSPDRGTIQWKGSEVRIDSPRAAAALGIGMVHQHDRLVAALTVGENFALVGRSSFTIPRDDISNQLKDLTDRYGGSIDPDARVSDLSVGERQWVSLLRALTGDVSLLVLDEPTTTLTPLERDRLFGALRDYRASGLSVIFITHKLDEVFALCDRVTVMRRGQAVDTLNVADTTREELARLMVGRDVDTYFERHEVATGVALLLLEGLSVRGARQRVTGLDLAVRSGEIVGIAGVDGNGQRELVEAITGIRAADAGSVRFSDGSTGWHAGRSASVARIPEDRHRHGLALGRPLWENVHLGRWRHRGLDNRGLLNPRTARSQSEELLRAYDVVCSGPDQPAGELSGGNQQKAVLARELGDTPQLVIAMNPCRGLDIAASRFVLDQLLEVRSRGGGVLFVSYDLDEILAVSDRVLVMASGEVAGQVVPGPHAPEEIGLLMGGAKLGGPR